VRSLTRECTQYAGTVSYGSFPSRSRWTDCAGRKPTFRQSPDQETGRRPKDSSGRRHVGSSACRDKQCQPSNLALRQCPRTRECFLATLFREKTCARRVDLDRSQDVVACPGARVIRKTTTPTCLPPGQPDKQPHARDPCAWPARLPPFPGPP